VTAERVLAFLWAVTVTYVVGWFVAVAYVIAGGP
jgi:hypothetical protein